MGLVLLESKNDKLLRRRNSDTGRSVQSISYDVRTRTGRIVMCRGSHSSMHGASKLFARIDPEVRRIEAYGPDNALEIVYVWQGKRWEVELGND